MSKKPFYKKKWLIRHLVVLEEGFVSFIIKILVQNKELFWKREAFTPKARGEQICCFFQCAMVWCCTGGEGHQVHQKGFLVIKAEAKKAGSLLRRLHFPEDEKKLVWLPMLLDSYAIADTGVAVAIRDEGKKHNKKLACGKGCGNCCEHQKDLPLYPHELVGIYWYVSEKMTPLVRDILRFQLEKHKAGSHCPFLVDGFCSIHPVRPVGCRQFNVFSAPCAPGEDPFYTRRHDVLEPIAEYKDRAFAAVIPFYNFKNVRDLSAAIRLIRGQIMNIQTFDWKKLVGIMENYDSRTSKQV